jgi:putative ABC transport system permease protein
VRFADILGLSLSALWQQKTRTLLTTLGVVFGSFVLAASLSITQGVQETIERESHHSDYLRRIDVRPQWGGKESDIPAEELLVKGEMDGGKSERIRKALLRLKLRLNANGPQTALTRERLGELARIDHVESVVPSVHLYGWASFNGRPESADVASTVPENPRLRERVVAGRFFDSPDERGLAVSEFLLYRWGITDDAAVEGVLGKKVRLEFFSQAPGPGFSFFLQKPGGSALNPVEAAALEKVKKQLPRAIDKFDLSVAERDALKSATAQAPPKERDVLTEEFPIVAVLRLPSDDEARGRPWDETNAEAFLPVRTAEDLFFRSPAQRERGLDQAVLLADREEHVKEVMENARKMGLYAWGAQEFIDRERLMFLLIFGAMTSVAGVALLVAALGIANTMLMSVLERTREVGIMKAVGAGNGHVQMIFLLEGALIGLLGGCLGLALSRLAAIPADARVRALVSRDLKVDLKESLFVFPTWIIVSVIAFAAVVTTLAAVYPARRAAKVNPVTALRHE